MQDLMWILSDFTIVLAWDFFLMQDPHVFLDVSHVNTNNLIWISTDFMLDLMLDLFDKRSTIFYSRFGKKTESQSLQYFSHEIIFNIQVSKCTKVSYFISTLEIFSPISPVRFESRKISFNVMHHRYHLPLWYLW